MEEPTTPGPNLIEVWASVNLAGLPRGASASVDANDPEIAKLIEDSILVPHEDPPEAVASIEGAVVEPADDEAEEIAGDVPIPGIADEEIIDDGPQAAAS